MRSGLCAGGVTRLSAQGSDEFEQRVWRKELLFDPRTVFRTRMKLASLVPLIAAICNFVIVIFVASRGLRSILSREYFLWGIAITVWNLGTYFMFQVDDERDALFWARFLQFGVIFIPVTLFHLSLLIAQVSTRKFIR